MAGVLGILCHFFSMLLCGELIMTGAFVFNKAFKAIQSGQLGVVFSPTAKAAHRGCS